jgi:hypothetical protein
MLDPRAIAVQGIGYGVLLIALQGFAPAEQQTPPQGVAIKETLPKKQQRPRLEQPHRTRVEEERQAAEAQREDEVALAARQTRLARLLQPPPPTEEVKTPERPPLQAPIARVVADVPAAPETAAKARIQAPTGQIEAADEFSADERDAQALIDRRNENQRRAAILIALLIADK